MQHLAFWLGVVDLDLFALRAMAVQPMHRLVVISDDPSSGLAGG